MIPPSTLEECPIVILAGGLGTRLRPVISDRPKGLAPIGDRPFLEIQIAMLREQGARRFILCVGHRADQIRECLGDGSRLGVDIDYSVSPRRCWAPAEPCGSPRVLPPVRPRPQRRHLPRCRLC